jgi:hypothetical protein
MGRMPDMFTHPETPECFAGPKQFNFRGHNYFYSGHVPAHANQRVDWLDARNVCREYCMDLISMETQEENNMIFRLIQQSEYYRFRDRSPNVTVHARAFPL